VKPARVMIVEDEFIVASDIQQTLLGYGYEIAAHEASGEEALTRAAELNPDIVIMDIVLKGEMTGIEAASEMKKRFGTPVIFLTSYADTDTLEKAKASAPYGYLVKPFKDRELRATIETALHRVTLERELRAREKQLSTANRLLEAVFSSTDVMLAYLDRDFTFIRVNRAYAEAGRRSPEDFIGQKHFAMYPDEGNEKIFRRVVESGQPHTERAKPYKHPAQPERGTTYWDWSLVPIKDAEGHVTHLVLTLSDVTDKANFSLAIQKAGRELQTIIDSVPAYIFMKDRENNFVRVNRSFAESVGMTPLEVVGRPAGDFFPETAAEEFHRDDRDVLDSGQAKKGIREQRTLPGGEKIFITDKVPLFDEDGRVVRILGVATDITSLAEKEKELRESEERYRLAIEKANDAFVLTQDGKIIATNTRFLELFGYDHAEETVGRPITDFVHPDDRGRATARYQARESGQDLPGRYEFRGLRRNNTSPYIEVSSTATTFRGRPVVLAYLRDISDRKEAEQNLREARDRLQAVLDSIESVVYVADMETHEVLLINDYTRRIFGDMEGKVCWQTLQERQSGPCDFCTNPQLVDEAGEPTPGIVWEFENTRNGRWYECHDRAIRWLDGRLVRFEIAADITERKFMEQETHKARNLESIGILAAGIAHDFNNLLTTVLGNIELAKIYTGPEDRVRMWLDEAGGATEGARRLTNQLLTFSRGGVPVRRSLSIGELLAQACAFALSGTSILCETEFPQDTWPVSADRDQLSQVFHNLFMNAREAMPGGGTIKASTQNLDLRAGNDLLLPAGHYVQIEIVDSGRGIPEETLPKIFDPYFTTKPMGATKGTGLGLAICYSVVDKHGGQILVDSKVGEGTRVTVRLPASQDAPESEGTAPETDEPAKGLERSSRGRVLLMEDDEPIIRVTSEIFRHLGMDFEVAREGEEAVDLFTRARDRGEPFDAVILDLTVRGGMGAVGAMELLRALDPDVRAAVSSGYGDDPVIRGFRDFGFRAALVKPYRVNNIEKVLKGMAPEAFGMASDESD